MATGARITLTSPDPSSNNAPEHTEHKPMIFSESDSDTVTFNAHKHKYNEKPPHGASSSPSSIPFNSLETDESAASPERSRPQKVKITIDSVAPYESNGIVVDSSDDADDDVDEKMQSSNRVDKIEESEMNTKDSQDQRNQEKRTKNDEL